MTLVPKVERIEEKTVSIKLSVALLSRLDAYCALVSRDRSEVVSALLTYALDRDGEFAAHEGREPAGRRRRRSRVHEEAGVTP